MGSVWVIPFSPRTFPSIWIIPVSAAAATSQQHRLSPPSPTFSPSPHPPARLMLMGVIDIYNASSLRLTNISISRRPSCGTEGNKRTVVAMASTTPVQKKVSEVQQRLTGDSFIRPHLRNLSPYQSILPFEVFQSKRILFPLWIDLKSFFLEFWWTFLRKMVNEVWARLDNAWCGVIKLLQFTFWWKLSL